VLYAAGNGYALLTNCEFVAGRVAQEEHQERRPAPKPYAPKPYLQRGYLHWGSYIAPRILLLFGYLFFLLRLIRTMITAAMMMNMIYFISIPPSSPSPATVTAMEY